jgi:hypothetical protein
VGESGEEGRPDEHREEGQHARQHPEKPHHLRIGLCYLGFVVCGLWFVVYGLWFMCGVGFMFRVSGLRFKVYDLWCMDQEVVPTSTERNASTPASIPRSHTTCG